MATLDTVLLAGASGVTGREVLDVLSGTDVTVRAMTRSGTTAERLSRLGADDVVVGDLLEQSDAERAVKGVDAVVTTVGTRPLDVWRAAEFVDGPGNVNLVSAAEAAGVETLVMQSSLGVGDDTGSLMARTFRLVVSPVIEAKTRAEDAIWDSDLRYTIVRPAVLVGRWASGDVHVAPAGTGVWGVTPRRDLARLLVGALVTEAAADRTFEVGRNPFLGNAGLDIEWTLPE